MKTIYTILVLSVLLLAGCVGPKYVEPKVDVESDYNKYMYDTLATNTDTVLNIRWWKFIDDPVFDTLVAHALAYNKDVLMAATRIEQSRAIYGMAKADQWPSFGVNGKLNYGEVGGGQNNSTQLALGMNWELLFWGRYRAAGEGAKADLASSEYGLRSVQIALIAEVANNYNLILDLQNRVDIARKTMASRDSALFIMNQRFESGIIPEIDMNQAQINQAIAESAVPNYERQLAMAQNALAVLLGEKPQIIMNSNYNIDSLQFHADIPYGVPSLLLLRRPDILAGREAYHAQFKKINVAVSQRLPSINISGMLGASSMALGNITGSGMAWSAGAGLLGPIFEFGKNKRRVDFERAKAREALINYENTINIAFKEVEDALISIRTYKEQLKAKEKQVKAAMNAERLAKMRYDKGVSSYLEVLDNQRSAFDAQLELSIVKRQLLDAYVALYKALGGGWLSAEEEQQAKQNQ